MLLWHLKIWFFQQNSSTLETNLVILLGISNIIGVFNNKELLIQKRPLLIITQSKEAWNLQRHTEHPKSNARHCRVSKSVNVMVDM